VTPKIERHVTELLLNIGDRIPYGDLLDFGITEEVKLYVIAI
jgi:hypothetical protein